MTSERAEMADPEVGQVWRDTDPRGGPTFRIVGIEGDVRIPSGFAVVTDLLGKRKRRIRLNRFNRYELLTDCEDICMEQCVGACGGI